MKADSNWEELWVFPVQLISAQEKKGQETHTEILADIVVASWS